MATIKYEYNQRYFFIVKENHGFVSYLVNSF